MCVCMNFCLPVLIRRRNSRLEAGSLLFVCVKFCKNVSTASPHICAPRQSLGTKKYNRERRSIMGSLHTRTIVATLLVVLGVALVGTPAAYTQKKPNILVIMGDDIGMWNIGAYHRGMMAGRTPNLDKMAKEGMLFTDYYAEASCTAGRANFIMGELPIRTGMTTVGQAGAKIGIPAEACTIATALKAQGYATGQFGKNHLGDLNEFLPTVHGFDEFFGYLYHLDAMEDPAHPNYPQNLLGQVSPRNMVHSWATTSDDATVMPRWGKVGKQKIEDAGTLYPERMKTVDNEIRDLALKFIEKAKTDNKPFFCWLNPTRMHIVTHLSEKYEKMRNSENGWSEEEAGMAQLDDDIGLVMQKLKDLGLDDNTIVVFTTDKGPSKRHEIFYLGESTVGAVRIDDYKFRFIDQPGGWMGEKTHVDVPYLINLRLDPFERQGWPGNLTKDGAQQYFDWFKFQFWRFVFVQQVMGKELQTFLEYPPMQRGASFNLDAVKAEMAAKMAAAEKASKGTGQ